MAFRLEKQLSTTPVETRVLACIQKRPSDAAPPRVRHDAEVEQAWLRRDCALVAHAALVFTPHLDEAEQAFGG